jgi:hypothetical protein
MQHYSIIDFLLMPVYTVIILMVANLYAKKKREAEPYYKYFVPGLAAKMVGGVGLALVYTLYYPGGDTIEYYHNVLALQNLAVYDFSSFLHVMTAEANLSLHYYFNSETGYAVYARDPKAWAVVKIALFIVTPAFKSYLTTTVLCATVSFSGTWRLYKVFAKEFPNLYKEMAVSFLFIPSVFFWGSGLLKDTFTLGAVGFFFSALYAIFVKKEKIFANLIIIFLSSYVISSIKPYILVGLLPAVILWLVQLFLGKIKIKTIRALSMPFLMICGVTFGYLLMMIMGDALAEYQVESILEKAKITQRDLKSDYYQGNSFDIGDFDSTVPSMLSKFPIATFSAIFRPLIIESNNLVMFISGFENLLLLIFAIRVLILLRVYRFFGYFFKHHMLTFSLFFAMFFAYSVGLSTSNFGSLVRYKIPCIPFFVASMYLMRHLRLEDIKEEEKNRRQVVDQSTFAAF